MPVPLLKHHFCRRSGKAGPKAHAHAAYLSGTKLDDGFGHTADFTPKGGIIHAEVWVPENAPAWARDRGELWRQVEARESKTTRPARAILAHKFIGALPHELTLEENIRYVKDFVREQFMRKGYAADWAIHAPDRGGDSRNYHVHIMVPVRRFEQGDWAKNKDRFPTNGPSLSHFIRDKQTAFFTLQNRYLEKNGIAANICREGDKWRVVSGRQPASTSHGVNRHAVVSHMPRSSGGKRSPSQQMSLPLTATPFASGMNIPEPSRSASADVSAETVGRIAVTTPAYTTSAHRPPLRLPYNGRGWPPEAVMDWQQWGSSSPGPFFAKWPLLRREYPARGGEAP